MSVCYQNINTFQMLGKSGDAQCEENHFREKKSIPFDFFSSEIYESKGCTIDKNGKKILESHKFLSTLNKRQINKWTRKKDDYQSTKNKV